MRIVIDVGTYDPEKDDYSYDLAVFDNVADANQCLSGYKHMGHLLRLHEIELQDGKLTLYTEYEE